MRSIVLKLCINLCLVFLMGCAQVKKKTYRPLGNGEISQKPKEEQDIRSIASSKFNKWKKSRKKSKRFKRSKRKDSNKKSESEKKYSKRSSSNRSKAMVSDSGQVTVSKRHWKTTFFDDFKGKPTDSVEDKHCYDEVKPQCHIWRGQPGTSYNCARTTSNLSDRTYVGTSFFPNLIGAIKSIEPNYDTNRRSESELLSKYDQIISAKQKHLNKCTWTNYELLNWMATDYNGKYSAKMDPTQVEVDPSGKGYLILSARKANTENDCAYGGSLNGNNECLIQELPEINISTSVTYWVDTNPNWPGIFYAKENGSCPHGGSGAGNETPNCWLWHAPTSLLDEDVQYFVKSQNQKGIFYANKKYRCKANITYHNGVTFNNLNCPILNGGLLSSEFKNKDDNNKIGGTSQQNGRYEVKLKIPKGKGSFPAAWLRPLKGGWPYSGGEIDIIEARDGANEVYQTYHNGKCFDKNTLEEIFYKPSDPSKFIDSSDCKDSAGLKSFHMHKGKTSAERDQNEFHTRDHVFAVEWEGSDLRWFLNNEATNNVIVGTKSEMHDPAQPDIEWDDLPTGADRFTWNNFPHMAFFYILNHSTYVDKEWLSQNPWAAQHVYIDYVKTSVQCKTKTDFCPTGGDFVEELGCKLRSGEVIDSPCSPIDNSCPNGGKKVNNQCIVETLTNYLHPDTDYWIDSDPRWPGVYYNKISGGCPYGGGSTSSVNCQVKSLSKEIVESGVAYKLNKTSKQIFYEPTFTNESNTNTSNLKCPGIRVELGELNSKPVCKALPHFTIKKENCDGSIWNEHCIWDRGDWYKARRLKEAEALIECTMGRKKLGELEGKAVCKALPHFKIKKERCSGKQWSGYCLWDKSSWWRARMLK
ncbi:MAG: hypothetical protein ACI9QD_000561 [Thermoproteota archaeon]|jgi:hypothetical protein